MSDDKCKSELERIAKMDPYWQKYEWLKIRVDQPEFYKELFEYNKSNDRSKEA